MNRVTIMLEEGVYTSLRKLQSNTIIKTNKNCSFSKIVNQVVTEGLKKTTKKKSKQPKL
jgi:hypothetical protein